MTTVIVSLFFSLYLLFLFLPVKHALILVFIYAGFDGFLKVMSNGHPVIQLGVDIMLSSLAIKEFTLAWIQKKPLSEILPPHSGAILLLFAWLFISMLNPYSLGLLPSIAGVKLYLIPVLLFYWGYQEGNRDENFDHFLWTWILIGAAHSYAALYQGTYGPNTVTWIHPGFAEAIRKVNSIAFRPFGFTQIPGGAAVFAHEAAIFSVFYLVFSKKISSKIFQVQFLVAAIVTLLICQSRALLLRGMAGAFAIVVLYFLTVSASNLKNRIRALVLIGGVAASLALALPHVLSQLMKQNMEIKFGIARTLTLFQGTESFAARSGATDRFTRFVSVAPMGAGLSRTGAASGTFRKENDTDPYFGPVFFSDNFWLAVLVDLGIPGLLLFAYLVIRFLWGSLKGTFRANDELTQQKLILCFATLFALVLGSAGAETLSYKPDAFIFWFMAGISVKLLEESHARS